MRKIEDGEYLNIKNNCDSFQRLNSVNTVDVIIMLETGVRLYGTSKY